LHQTPGTSAKLHTEKAQDLLPDNNETLNVMVTPQTCRKRDERHSHQRQQERLVRFLNTPY
jgi:exonuclease I